MRIECIEIQNFRKLASIRMDFSEQTTLLVGANNSGKTAALVALRAFLVKGISAFQMNDVTLSNWAGINGIGETWLASTDENPPEPADWSTLLPALDLWLHVEDSEFHRVSQLIPTLEWTGGRVGTRLVMEPGDEGALIRDFLDTCRTNADIKKARVAALAESGASQAPDGEGALEVEVTIVGASVDIDPVDSLSLWPENLVDYLKKHLHRYFQINYYLLDPGQLATPSENLARPQELPNRSVPLTSNPLDGLIRVDEINAQRGFGEHGFSGGEATSSTGAADASRLSRQLSDYYSKHLNPSELPDVSDLEALSTIAVAQKEFDKRLEHAFESALIELQVLGYPGVTDPKIFVSSRLSATDSLNHDSAVSFALDVADGEASVRLQLPESYNGLGYQNLISMIFRLMSFRDRWMLVGKLSKSSAQTAIEPLHLVLVEEPEAHLHVQVQQVFAKKAYDVLRNHPDLNGKSALSTQLVISTHSSHVAHELPFASLRYFRRLPAGSQKSVPTSSVISLADVFGPNDSTEAFVTRYLRAQHSDLFFADAIILVEGPAERMLLPNFIRASYSFLNSDYITLLEIGGSHAHRLRPLIDALQLPTLVITDLDASSDGVSTPVRRGEDQTSSNPTLSSWAGLSSEIDELLDLPDDQKVIVTDSLFSTRFAYQTPVLVTYPDGQPHSEALPGTFEDAMAFANLEFFAGLDGVGLTKKFRDAISASSTITALSDSLFKSLKTGTKAEFALDIIAAKKFDSFAIPKYISDGLDWLEAKLRKQAVAVAEIIVPSEEEAPSA